MKPLYIAIVVLVCVLGCPPTSNACVSCLTCLDTWNGKTDCVRCNIACIHASPSCDIAEAYVPGFFLSKEAGRLVLAAVIPGSQAEQAGLRPGDQLVLVDGQSVEGGSVPAAWLSLRSYYPKSVAVKARREGKTHNVTLELQSMRHLLEAMWEATVERDAKLDGLTRSSNSHMPPAFLTGIRPRLSTDGVYVSGVLPGSPAERSGLEPGARILSINEVQAEKLTPQQILGSFQSNTPMELRLVVQKGSAVEKLHIRPVGLSRIIRDLVDMGSAQVASFR